MKLAANLSWLYTEFAFTDRLQACAEDGFRYAECMFPYDYPAELLREKAESAGVEWVLINASAGNWEQGERGLAVSLENRQKFRKSIEQAFVYANTLGVRKVHVLAGTVDLQNSCAYEAAWACYMENLAWLAHAMRDEAIDWLIEPLNRRDVPGYLLSEQARAHALIEELNCPNLGVQMDLYHCQLVEGNALEALAHYLPAGNVKHLQFAGVPDRHEPACVKTQAGGLDYSKVQALLGDLAYSGHIGCEYRPRATTRDGLGWIRQLGFSGTM